MARKPTRAEHARFDPSRSIPMTFKAVALDPARFVSWSRLTDAELHARGGRRYAADKSPGFPCRVSLHDAEPGEALILLPFEHHGADSPYRASGPIFVGERAQRWPEPVDVVPPVLLTRLLSVRAYDQRGMMEDAEVVEGGALQKQVTAMFADPRIDYLHVHFARRGCYACSIVRA
jgi:hypothetical protein